MSTLLLEALLPHAPSMEIACALASEAMDEPLIGSATMADRFIFVSWPKNQWPLAASKEPSLAPLLRWAQHYDAAHGGKTSIRWIHPSDSSLRTPQKYREMTDLWLLPHGHLLKNITLSTVAEHLDVLFLPSTTTPTKATSLSRVITVCTHGKYDQCCAKYGQAVWQKLVDSKLDATVVQASHLGGHRFAATLIDFVPGQPGRMYGRIKVDELPTFIEHVQAKTIWLDRYRGRVDLSPGAQIAEAEAIRHGAPSTANIQITNHAESQYTATWPNKRLQVTVAPQPFQGPKSCNSTPETWNRWHSASVSFV